MKRNLLATFLLLSSVFATAQTATNFTCNDCAGNSHTLFSELDAGKVVVICWVMPCGACTGPALTDYNVVNSYQTSNPNTVFLYLVDDYANTSCTSLNSWANTNGISATPNSLRFSNSAIDMMDYGSTGMPKTVVIGGPNHTVFYNANNSVNVTALQNAINSAISATGINAPAAGLSSLNVYPSPARDRIEVKVGMAKSSQVQIQLFGMDGNLVREIYNGKLDAGEQTIPYNSATLSAGTYLLKFSDGTSNQFTNVVVVR